MACSPSKEVGEPEKVDREKRWAMRSKRQPGHGQERLLVKNRGGHWTSGYLNALCIVFTCVSLTVRGYKIHFLIWKYLLLPVLNK